MIDNMDQVERLISRLQHVLPLPARAPTDLIARLRRKSPAAKLAWDCEVTDVLYSGDDGGVLCNVRFDKEEAEVVFLVSITHLAFDRRLPIAHDIAAYQKHRIKRLRKAATDRRAAY